MKNKKYYQTEIILHSYIKQYRVFGLSNNTRIMHISMTDYTSPIATVEGTSSYIWRIGGEDMSNFVTYSTINLQPFRVIKTPMTKKTLQSVRHTFRCRHSGTTTISVGMLENIYMLRELNKWTLIEY